MTGKGAGGQGERGAGPRVTAFNGIRIHNMTKWRLGHVTNACIVSMCVCVCQYPCNTFHTHTLRQTEKERERDRQRHPHVMHTRVCLDYKQLQLRSPRCICIALQGNTHSLPPSHFPLFLSVPCATADNAPLYVLTLTALGHVWQSTRRRTHLIWSVRHIAGGFGFGFLCLLSTSNFDCHLRD